MDMVKIGGFLRQLRKEQGMTQEQLGERLGVTNKTVSRWETGTYLPPVEMLQALSDLYGITINEILSAQYLQKEQYQEKAEENIKATLGASAFSVKEKQIFFAKKWDKEHRFVIILETVGILIMLGLGLWLEELLVILGADVLGLARIYHWQNQKAAYVEDRAFDGSGQ